MTINLYQQNIETAFESSVGKNGANMQRFSYWLDKLIPAIIRMKSHPKREAEPVFSLPSRTDDLAEIEAIATHIASYFGTLVVVGMGGSSLSGETLSSLGNPSGLKLLFLDNIDPHSISVLIETLNWRDTAFLVISKSGNTVETLAQMAVLLRTAKSKRTTYAKHFFVITITNGNPLHTLAKAHGIRVFAHDPKLGGRFSILSLVGLIPAAAIGLDIRALRAGAQAFLLQNFSTDLKHAPAAKSAALHMALIEKNIRLNVMMHYCDRLGGLANWYRQCWGESLGKCSKATTPVRSRCATDQHSQLQLYLDGPKDKFFTLVMLENSDKGERIEYEGSIDPRLDFLKGHTLGDLMVAQQRATVSTLIENNCPVRRLVLKELNEEVLGALLMHFSLEVIYTAQLLNIDAFNQPAVEQSKALAIQYMANDNAQSTAIKRRA